MRLAASAAATAVLATTLFSATRPAEVPVSAPRAFVAATARFAGDEARETEGTWTITPHEGRLHLALHYLHNSNWGRGVERADLRGLTDAQMQAAVSTPVAFRIERESGVFQMEGAFRDSRGAGHFVFLPNLAFAGTLRSLGVTGTEAITERELLHLAMADASSARVRELTSLLGAFDAEDLIKLSIHDVTPEYVRELRGLGISGTSSVEGVVEMRIHNISAAYARELESLGFRDLSREQLLQMGIHGVSAEQVRELAALGYRGLSAEQLVQMRIHDITPEYIRHMRAGGFTSLDPEGLVQLRIHRVTPEYVRALAELGYRDLSRETLLQMGIHGVTPEFIREMRQAGYDNLSAETLVRMRIHGIDSEFVRGVRREG